MDKQPKQDSVEKLFGEYRPRLQSFIRKQVANKEDAEDILQDVFYQLTKALERSL